MEFRRSPRPNRAAPLLLLIDDGWPAAASWDERMRTADELIARAEADNRGVAVLPLSEPTRDISLMTAGAARVQIRQLKPKPRSVDRSEALPLLERFLETTPDVELVWLADGVDLGKGSEFVTGLKRVIGSHPLTIVDGGIATPHALAGADNAAGALTVKVLRAQAGAADNGMVNAIDLKGLALGEAPFRFAPSAARPTPPSTCRSRSATTWRGLRSPASVRRAPCSCSTSAGGGAPSASSPARPPTVRSR